MNEPEEVRSSERELDRERRLYRAVLETAVDGIVTIDQAGTIITVNTAVEKIFGYRPEELIGQNVRILMPEPYHGEHDRYLSNYLGGQDARIIGIGREVTGKRKDDSTFPLELAVSETRTEDGLIFTGIVRDVSARKVAEEQLRRERALLQAVVETAVDGILTIDEQGTILTANTAVQEVFGYEPAELVGRNVRMLMPTPYHEEHDSYLRNYLEGGDARIIGIGREVTGRRKDGTTFPLELAVSETLVEQGRIFTGIVRDISERKQFIEWIQALNSDLEDRVKERTQELQDLVAELHGFNHSIAHDLRGPLRTIHANAHFIMEDYGHLLDDEGKQCLESLGAGVVKMSQIMDDLLAYSRIGRQNVDARPVNLSEIAQSIVESMQIEGMVEIQPEMIVKGDPTLLRIVLENLIGNAFKYRRPGVPSEVKVGREEKTIYVKDNGTGFDMRFIDKVFEPFQRLHADRDYPGNGIGLANVKRIVRKHGGEVWAQAMPNEGATFFFTLANGGPA